MRCATFVTFSSNIRIVLQCDHELAEAIELEYYRFEPYLRAAVQDIISADNQHYVYDVDKGQREFFVSFYGLSRVERIRSMRTEKIGKLMSVSGTVTRSTEVRPELLYGCFVCKKCATMHRSVEQQFQYTEPHICKNPQCPRGDFQLILDQSSFVDWQRLRVQENADEIPPGSMPRSIDVICRNEVVEMAKAGDKVIFTGSIAVLPDGSGLARAGESTVGGKITGRGDNFGDGVQGLKKLGVKEMTYRMVFVACAVQPSDHRQGSAGRHGGRAPPYPLGESLGGNGGRDGDADTDPTPMLSESEKIEILAIRNTAHLYTKMVESVCPSVFGHLEVSIRPFRHPHQLLTQIRDWKRLQPPQPPQATLCPTLLISVGEARDIADALWGRTQSDSRTNLPQG